MPFTEPVNISLKHRFSVERQQSIEEIIGGQKKG